MDRVQDVKRIHLLEISLRHIGTHGSRTTLWVDGMRNSVIQLCRTAAASRSGVDQPVQFESAIAAAHQTTDPR